MSTVAPTRQHLPRYTCSKYANAYIEAAKRLGLDTEIISREFAFCRVYNNRTELYIHNCHLSCNSFVAVQMSNAKNMTLHNFRANGMPVPEHRLFVSPSGFRDIEDLDAIFEYAKDKYPLVLKPNRGFGGRGVVANICDDDELALAIAEAQQRGVRNVLVERFVSGRHYRVWLLKGNILKFRERIPANVIGNGRSSIRELIDQKNRLRKVGGSPVIPISSRLHRTIAKYGLAIDSVPAGRETVWLSDVSNWDAGGELGDVEFQHVPCENLQYLRKAADISRLEFVGLDVISKDITRPFSDVGWVINEVNSHPATIASRPDISIEQLIDIPTKLFRCYFFGDHYP